MYVYIRLSLFCAFVNVHICERGTGTLHIHEYSDYGAL